jgi:hypothetical protein
MRRKEKHNGSREILRGSIHTTSNCGLNIVENIKPHFYILAETSQTGRYETSQ